MDFLNEEIIQYCEKHSLQETDVLCRLNRETNLKVPMPRMLSGHLQGLFLSMFSRALKPKTILEVGTYTGYSAICLASGLTNDGKLYTIDLNDELEKMAKNYWEEAGLTNKIELYLGDAMKIIPTLDMQFDLVFIDADKKNYLHYYKMVIDKVPTGGYVLADNVLWSGKVLNEPKDSDTQAIHEFNVYVANDSRVESFLLPLRDGIMILRKK